MRKFFFVYILLCSDDSLYVGVTDDSLERAIEHNTNEDPIHYCFSRRPVQLVFTRLFTDSNDAIKYEKQVKKWSRAKKWALILGDYKRLHVLARCRNESNHIKFKLDQSPGSKVIQCSKCGFQWVA